MDTLIRELDGIEVSWPLMNTGDIRAEIGTILYALTTLSNRVPLLSECSFVDLLYDIGADPPRPDFSVAKVQKRLADMM